MPRGMNHRHYHVEADGRLDRTSFQYRRKAWEVVASQSKSAPRLPLASRRLLHPGLRGVPAVMSACLGLSSTRFPGASQGVLSLVLVAHLSSSAQCGMPSS